MPAIEIIYAATRNPTPPPHVVGCNVRIYFERKSQGTRFLVSDFFRFGAHTHRPLLVYGLSVISFLNKTKRVQVSKGFSGLFCGHH